MRLTQKYYDDVMSNLNENILDLNSNLNENIVDLNDNPNPPEEDSEDKQSEDSNFNFYEENFEGDFEIDTYDSKLHVDDCYVLNLVSAMNNDFSDEDVVN